MSSQKSVMTSLSSLFPDEQAPRAPWLTGYQKPDDPHKSILSPSVLLWTTAPACEALPQGGPAEPSQPHGSHHIPQLWSALQTKLQPVLLLGVGQVDRSAGQHGWTPPLGLQPSPPNRVLWPPSFVLPSAPGLPQRHAKRGSWEMVMQVPDRPVPSVPVGLSSGCWVLALESQV